MKSENKRIYLKSLRQVTNPTSIHGVYPYRGKISARDAESIISQFESGKLLLDPFCGSGTIIYEAHRAGLISKGFDTNPLAVWLAKGKLYMSHTSLQHALEEAEVIIAKALMHSPEQMPLTASKHFHDHTANEIMSLVPFLDQMTDYIKACFFGTIALAARGCNHYKWTSSTVGKDISPKRYINFYDKFMQKIKKHYYPLNNSLPSEIFSEDSRQLSRILKEGTVDYVFTSPPYFDGLDYTAYYGKIIYSILNLDRNDIKNQLIQTVATYKEDMQKVLNEIIKVTHDKSLIVFVVGDKKIGNQIINGGEFFSDILHHKPNEIYERTYTGSSSQVFDKLNNTKRREQIVIWDRSKW